MYIPTSVPNVTDAILARNEKTPLVPSQLPEVNPLTVPYRLQVRGAHSGQFLFKPVPLNAISSTHKLSQNCANRKIHHVNNGSIGSTVDIPLISCDLNSTILSGLIEELQQSQVQCAVFYSNLEAGCALDTNTEWFKKSIPNTFTMVSNGDTIQLLSRIDMEDTISTIYKTSVLSGLEIFGIVIVCIAVLIFGFLAWFRYTKRTIHVSRAVLREIPLLRVTTNRRGEEASVEANGICDPHLQSIGDEKPVNTVAQMSTSSIMDPPRALRGMENTKEDEEENTLDTPLANNNVERPPEYLPIQENTCPFPQAPESANQQNASPPAAIAASAATSSSVAHIPLDVCLNENKHKVHHHWNFFKQSKPQMGTYVHGDDDDICPICLEVFQTGDILRQLPCNHYFHAKCVDPWLLKSSTKCPICRGDVLSKQKANIDHRPPAEGNHHSGFTYTYVRRNLRRLSRTLRGEHIIPEPVYTGQVSQSQARPSMSRSNTMPGRIHAARN